MADFAYLVGSNGPANEPTLPLLKYAVSDVRRMKRALALPHANYRISSNCDEEIPIEDPHRLLSTLEEAGSQAKIGDRILFYFSGHGFHIGGELYLATKNSTWNLPESTTIPFRAISNIIAASQARQKLVILDCCHSAAAAGSGVLGVRGKSETEHLKIDFHSPAAVILCASGVREFARELDATSGGVLTHFLVEAIGERFDEADQDRDGFLSVSDAASWVSNEIDSLSRSLKEQIPSPRIFQAASDKYLITSSKRASPIEVEQLEKIEKSARKLAEIYARAEVDGTNQKVFVKYGTAVRPVKQIAGSLHLGIIDRLLDTPPTNELRSAYVAIAATIVAQRRLTAYASKLADLMLDKELAGNTLWRITKAIYDCWPLLKASERDALALELRSTLPKVCAARDYPQGRRFTESTLIKLIAKLARYKLKIDESLVLTKDQFSEYTAWRET